ncbi:MAG: hypothetical protein ACXW2U_14565 [Telluria sp.]
MKTTPRWMYATAILALAGLATGCASTTRQVDRNAPVSAALLDEAKFVTDSARETNELMYRLSTAAGDACAASDAPYRAPFSLLFNAPDEKSDALRTAIFRVSGLAELPAIQAHDTAVSQYDGARIVSINRTGTINLARAFAAMQEAVRDNKPIELALDDGRTLSATPVAACPSLAFTDFGGSTSEALASGAVEVTPRSWVQLARNRDERAFILARSIFFTGAEGEARLRHALYAGAAVSGVLRGLTFGVSGLIVDPKAIAVRVRRSANRADADAFALRLMQRAGFDRAAALALAERSVSEGGAWPKDCDELKFDAERLATLKANLQ